MTRIFFGGVTENGFASFEKPKRHLHSGNHTFVMFACLGNVLCEDLLIAHAKIRSKKRLPTWQIKILMRSTPQIQRQWHILIALMSRRMGMTIKELAEEVSVDDRTIRRDLNALRKANFPLEERITAHGCKHWKIIDGGANVPIHFNWSEAVALYLGRRLLDPLAGTNFWTSAQSAFSKIRAMLGEAALAQLSKVEKTFLQTMPGVSDYSSKSELIDLLRLAIEDHKIAWVAYQSERATEPVSLEMYPYGIAYHKGSLYLVAFSCEHNMIRHFKIDRVTVVDVQTLQFSPDPDFSLEKHFANSFGIYQSDEQSSQPKKIRIRFNSEAARYVQEKTWHPSQKLSKEKDGSVVLEVRLNDTHEIKAWALSFGPKATVLEPKSLRDEVVSDVEATLNGYEAKQRAKQ